MALLLKKGVLLEGGADKVSLWRNCNVILVKSSCGKNLQHDPSKHSKHDF